MKLVSKRWRFGTAKHGFDVASELLLSASVKLRACHARRQRIFVDIDVLADEQREARHIDKGGNEANDLKNAKKSLKARHAEEQECTGAVP